MEKLWQTISGELTITAPRIGDPMICIDRERLQRLIETAQAAHDARYEIALTPPLAKAIFKHQRDDFDPIP